MAWKFHDPRFVFDNYNPTFTKSSTWLGHRAFAYDWTRFSKPGTIVELGTYFGASFFCFCQAAADGGIPSKCYAVDTWEGDPHSGWYGNEVYQFVSAVKEQWFPQQATLIRSTFDEAVKMFADESIDLLHIDGYHTLDAVTHDFATWLPKLAPNGVVLFHDIAIRYAGFGVFQFWDQVKQNVPHLEFEHSAGLGVLFPKGCDASYQEVLAMKDILPEIYKRKAEKG